MPKAYVFQANNTPREKEEVAAQREAARERRRKIAHAFGVSAVSWAHRCSPRVVGRLAPELVAALTPGPRAYSATRALCARATGVLYLQVAEGEWDYDVPPATPAGALAAAASATSKRRAVDDDLIAECRAFLLRALSERERAASRAKSAAPPKTD